MNQNEKAQAQGGVARRDREADRAEVLPVAGLLTRNADIDLRRGELAWSPK